MTDAAMTFQHERLASLPAMDWGQCPSCGEQVTTEDGTCIRISLPHQAPVRFHDECFERYLEGLNLFDQHILRGQRPRRIQ